MKMRAREVRGLLDLYYQKREERRYWESMISTSEAAVQKVEGLQKEIALLEEHILSAEVEV